MARYLTNEYLAMEKKYINNAVAEEKKKSSFISLDEENVATDPFEQFRRWYEEAVRIIPDGAEAVALATATTDAIPSVRMVLVKEFDERGFVFYTNYQSRKAQELESNPKAAMLFFWKDLKRQVRIEGIVQRILPEESQRYFATRERESKIGAWASKQSSILPNRSVLEHEFQEWEQKFAGKIIPCPPHWGGYRLIPDVFEFWQEREHRLHDRIQFRKNASGWRRERLAP